LEHIHLRVCVSILPREQGDDGIDLTGVQPVLPGQHNVKVYINEFKDLINMSGYTDPIAIVLKFCRGLNAMTQDTIAESGTDRPCDNDFNSWFKAAHQLDLNHLANEAFHYAS
jgi:hypothetical protein